MRRRTCSDIESAEEGLSDVLVSDECADSFVGVD